MERKTVKAGTKRVQIWVPDVDAPGFGAECRRQSRLALRDPPHSDDLVAVAEVAEWGEE